jgi:DNA ligase D-like protein (predicted polymerase)
MRSHELDAMARRVIDGNHYMTLGTMDPDGAPRLSPVYYTPAGYRVLYWVSSPAAHHSANVAARPAIQIVIFDSTVPAGAGEAVYLAAQAGEVPDGELDAVVGEAFRRTAGARPFAPDELRGDHDLRLYRARVTTCEVHGRRRRRRPDAGGAGVREPARGGVELAGMAASEATVVDAGGRDLRVSNPGRVIFPATEHTRELTKLDIVQYYLAVGDGILRALHRRPVTLERWPKGVHEGIVVSTREQGGGDAFFQKRIPRGAPDYVETCRIRFPSGRHADEVCPTEVAVVGWCAQMGTITFHPWPVRAADVEHPDELRIDLDPQPGTDFEDAVRVAAEARVLLGDLGYTGFPKTSGGRGVHIYVRIEPRWTFTDVRHAAIAFGRELERRLPGRVTTRWWKEERGERIFVDYNQNARDRTIASAYSIRPKPGAPVSAPVAWDELPEVAPEEFTVASMPARFAEVGDLQAGIDDVAHSLQPLLEMYARDEAEGGGGDMPYPPDYPKMPGEPKRVQPSRDRDRPKP